MSIFKRTPKLEPTWTEPKPITPTWFDVAKKEIGVKEKRGGENPRIIEYHSTTTLSADEDEVSWCFTPETQILTEDGWVSFEELGEQKVAQVNDGKIEFVTPIRKVRKEYSGTAFEIDHASLKLVCDKGHRWFGNWDRDKPSEFRTLDKMTTEGLAIPCVEGQEKDYPIEDSELKFLAAFLSDGSHKYSTKEEPWRIGFEVSKDRKIERLKQHNPDHVYTQIKAYGRSKKPLTCFSFAYPLFINEVCCSYKELRKEFVNKLSKRQAKLFLEEYVIFDGHKKTDTSFHVYTSRPKLRDDLITLALMAGFCPRVNFNVSRLSGKPCWVVKWSSEKKSTFLKKQHIKEIEYDGYMYCVEVPSSLIIVRGETLTPVMTGNCSSFVNWCFKQVNIKGTNNAAARSWLNWGTELKEPKQGCVVIYWRVAPDSWQGHVGFVDRVEGGKIYTLGGNQGDAVSIKSYPKSQVLGYRWPKT